MIAKALEISPSPAFRARRNRLLLLGSDYHLTQNINIALHDPLWFTILPSVFNELTLCVTGIITLMVCLFYARQLFIVCNRNVQVLLVSSAFLFFTLCRVGGRFVFTCFQ
ncbi:hypothetical protein IW261DRAFT_1506895 [Armillaria novae-zelandiae]|uniref:Uncharacterized protein n=1 Tax=Armillaria novae-zelandiae TaxID=153914 RepID=A0AA39NVT6_9AGAR|nr:hypothetical protein IW261DRAFT_1506895 [Armillaria novae-zelandiae]